MKLAALTMIRHDGDVIEEFIRHTSLFVDEIYVYDNVSLDASPEILRSLQCEGLRVVVEPCDIIATEGEWDNNNGVIRDVLRRSGADYLALLDADEFLIAPSRVALETDLAALPAGTHGLVPWFTYVPTADTVAAEEPVLTRIRYRLAREARKEEKVILARALLDQAAAVVALGSHAVVNAKTQLLTQTQLAHFPVRSAAQIQAKALLGWSTYIAMGVDTPTLGFQWRRLYEQLTHKPAWSAVDLFEHALSYVVPGGVEAMGPPQLIEAPLPPVPRRYAHREMELLEVAFALTHQLARATADFKRRTRELGAAESARREIDLRDRFALLEQQYTALVAERLAP